MIENNPLTQLWEGLGRQVSIDNIIDEFERTPDMAGFIASMINVSENLRPANMAKITRLSMEFVVWWSMQVHT